MTPKKKQEILPQAWGGIITEMQTKSFEYNLPLVPFETWEKVCSFMKWASDERNSEAIVSLTLIGDEWRVICWHQEPSGTLHVKFNIMSEENQALLSDEEKEALDIIHCTIHSHNKAGAGQSGDDKDDELQKLGWHVTVGNMNNESMSTHARFNAQRNAKFDDDGNKIAGAFQEFIVFDSSILIEPIDMGPGIKSRIKIATKLHKEICEATPKGDLFPEEWKDRVKKPVATVNRYPGYSGMATNYKDEIFFRKDFDALLVQYDEAGVMVNCVFKAFKSKSIKHFTLTKAMEQEFIKIIKRLNKEPRFGFDEKALKIIAGQIENCIRWVIRQKFDVKDWYKKVSAEVDTERDAADMARRLKNGTLATDTTDYAAIRKQIDEMHGEGTAASYTDAELDFWAGM